MGTLGVNGQESGGSPCGLPPEGHGGYSAVAVGLEVEDGGDNNCSQVNRYSDVARVYQLSADNSGGVYIRCMKRRRGTAEGGGSVLPVGGKRLQGHY